MPAGCHRQPHSPPPGRVHAHRPEQRQALRQVADREERPDLAQRAPADPRNGSSPSARSARCGPVMTTVSRSARRPRRTAAGTPPAPGYPRQARARHCRRACGGRARQAPPTRPATGARSRWASCLRSRLPARARSGRVGAPPRPRPRTRSAPSPRLGGDHPRCGRQPQPDRGVVRPMPGNNVTWPAKIHAQQAGQLPGLKVSRFTYRGHHRTPPHDGGDRPNH